MSILMVFLAFNFIIIIHELGHFLVAKACKIKVLEFSLFMGPKLLSFKRGETQYSLRLLPILAYVKMEGEEERSESEGAFHKKPVWARLATIAAGPLANLLAAFVLGAILFSYTGYTTTKIAQFADDSGFYAAGAREGDVLLSYDGNRIYHYMETFEFLMASKGKPAKAEILRDGNVLEIDVVPQKIESYDKYKIGYAAQDSTTNSNVINSFTGRSPLREAGAKPQDRIISMNGQKVSTIKDISDFLQKNKEKPIDVLLDRSGEEVKIKVTPISENQPEQYYLGFAFGGKEATGIIDTLKESATFIFSRTRMVGHTFLWLVTGKVSIGNMVGPVGIVSSMNDVVQDAPSLMDKFLNLLFMTSYISVVVGATNLLPFPALDGSRLIVLAVEAIRRKPLSIEKEAAIMSVGLFLLIGLAIFVTIKDISNLTFVKKILGG